MISKGVWYIQKRTFEKCDVPEIKSPFSQGSDMKRPRPHVLWRTWVVCITKTLVISNKVNERFRIWKSTLNSPRLIPPFLQTLERSSNVLNQSSLFFSRENVFDLPLEKKWNFVKRTNLWRNWWKHKRGMIIIKNDNVLCTTRKTNIGIALDIRSEARAFLCPTDFSGLGTCATFPSS